jgi:hypothetical protein
VGRPGGVHRGRRADHQDVRPGALGERHRGAGFPAPAASAWTGC